MKEKPTYEELEKTVRKLKRDFARQGKELEDLKRFVERSQDVIYRYDIASRRFVLYTKAGYELYGAKDGKTVSTKTVLLSIMPDDRDRVREATMESLKPDRSGGEVEYRQQRADGSIRWMHDRWNVVRDKSGRPIAIEGIVRDNSDRKRVEEELRERERYLKAILSASPVGIGLVVKRKLDWANDSMYRMVGYEQGELFGQSARILYPDDKAFEHAGEGLNKGLLDSGAGEVDTQWVRKDGTVFDCTLRACALDPADPGRGLIVTATDVSQLKHAYKQLVESEDKFRTVFESSPDGYYQMDTNGCFLDGNKAAEEITGYKRHELLGKDFMDLDLLSSEDLPKAVKSLKENRLGRATGPDEFVLRRKDGRRVTVEIKTLPIKIKGKDVILGFARDVSERKNLEGQLQEAQKMEAIGTLAGGIAHDFNNILSAVIGFTDLALNEAQEGTSLHENLTEVLIAGNRATKLVQQILTMSRREKKKIKPIQIAPLIKEVLNMLRSTIPTSIALHENICSDPLIVSADPTQLHQVIVNLATNAKQAMPEGSGIIEICLEPVRFTKKDDIKYLDMAPGKYARITVSDNGKGIPSENLDKLFEPYFTTKERGEGTGLGLSVVHGIVKSHNGNITVYSEPGKGTTVQVYLPVIRKGSAELQARIEKPLPTGTEHILLIDDEQPIVKMQQRNLERLGYTVSARTSSVEALEAFRVSPDRFDLVITDMTMPNMTGDKLAQKIKAIRSDMPVILCTGFSEKIDGQQENLDIEEFLMKPVDQAKMAETVRRVLDAAKGDHL